MKDETKAGVFDDGIYKYSSCFQIAGDGIVVSHFILNEKEDKTEVLCPQISFKYSITVI